MPWRFMHQERGCIVPPDQRVEHMARGHYLMPASCQALCAVLRSDAGSEIRAWRCAPLHLSDSMAKYELDWTQFRLTLCQLSRVVVAAVCRSLSCSPYYTAVTRWRTDGSISINNIRGILTHASHHHIHMSSVTAQLGRRHLITIPCRVLAARRLQGPQTGAWKTAVEHMAAGLCLCPFP